MISTVSSIARALAWGSAAAKGPKAVAKRAARGQVYKAVAKGLRRF